MCGIAGFWNISSELSVTQMTCMMQRMAQSLHHRGPDGSGVWVDERTQVALGHQRLAIIDTSSGGHQPMTSADDRYVIAFNGEVYNFLDLRLQLESLGHKFRGHSDTEVMLASFSQWGVHGAIERFNGMFAFALWDRQERVLHLGRDRLGEKPLYYGWINQTLLFGSELKALKLHPNFQPEIDRNVLALLLRHNYIPAPYSIYQGIYKLPPGTLLTWNGEESRPTPMPYWSAKETAEQGTSTLFTGSESAAIIALETLLQEAVGLRMVADVPLGAFLSGGVDSSTIVALMQTQSSQPVKTFTIGFHEGAYNEAHYAKAIAQHLGTDHTELYVTPEEALAVIPKLPTLYDEPYSDVSQIPTFLVSQLARRSVTVSLSGDGGDELFAGYNRYFLGRKIWNAIGWIPPVFRQTTGHALTCLSPKAWNQVFASVSPILPAQLNHPNPGHKLHRLAEILMVEDADAMYKQIISHAQAPETLVRDGVEHPTALSDRAQWAQLSDFTQRMMFLDTVTYLPDDILVKVDRASMGVSLEARVPYLDHRVVEFAWQVPLSMKIRQGQGKWLLRQVLYKYVPQALIDRPKMGFGVPIGDWLRGSLRDWAEDLLDEGRLRQEGFLHPQPIRQMWAEHLSGNWDWQYALWDVLMFQAWLEETHG